MKAIYIGNDKLKEVPDMERPMAHNYIDGRKGVMFKEAVDKYNELKNHCKTFDITGSHSFEVGKEYVEGVNFEIKKRGFTYWGAWAAAQEHDDLYYAVAIPLPKEDGQDELWEAVVIVLKLSIGLDEYRCKKITEYLKQQFYITRNTK